MERIPHGVYTPEFRAEAVKLVVSFPRFFVYQGVVLMLAVFPGAAL